MKHALIIGGSKGLGLGLVREHLARDWRVTATGRTPSPELDALHQQANGRLAIEMLDIVKLGQVSALAQKLSDQKFDPGPAFDWERFLKAARAEAGR